MRTLPVALLILVCGEAAAQYPLNLGFERPGVDGDSRPWGWTVSARAPDASTRLDSVVVRSGRRSLRITRPPPTEPEPDRVTGAHALQLWIAPRFAWGERIRVTGWARTEGSATTGLSVESWGSFQVLAADTAAPADTAADGWRRHVAEIDVDSSAYSVLVTVALLGSGTAWFDDVTIEVGGRTYDTVPLAPGPSDADLAWLEARGTPFTTVDAAPAGAADAYADLAPITRLIGDSRIVALGESTHGTSEFFRVKHRILAFLVQHHGFRVFAIEANQLAVERINAYVLRGEGEARSAMRAMFRVWNTEEVLELVEWLRSYNEQRPDRAVEFIGFDMQDPRLPIDSLRAFLVRHDPALLSAADSLYGGFRRAWEATAYPQAPDSVRAGWWRDARSMWERVERRSLEWRATASTQREREDVEWAIQNADVVRQAARLAFSGAFADRDSAMAANLHWSLERRGHGTRAVVWAHDAHVSRDDDPESYFSGATMGVFLSKTYGAGYFAFGILTHGGTYSAVSTGQSRPIPFEAVDAPVGSVEEALHRIAMRRAHPNWIFELRGIRSDGGAQWLLQPRPVRFIGYAAEDWGFAPAITVGRQFDGLVFVDRTGASRPIGRETGGGSDQSVR